MFLLNMIIAVVELVVGPVGVLSHGLDEWLQATGNAMQLLWLNNALEKPIKQYKLWIIPLQL